MAVREPFEPQQLDRLACEPLREPRACELRHRGCRARLVPTVDEGRRAQREKAGSGELATQPCYTIPRHVEAPRLGEPVLEHVDDPGEAAELLRGDALEVERVHDDVPAPIDLADEILRR